MCFFFNIYGEPVFLWNDSQILWVDNRFIIQDYFIFLTVLPLVLGHFFFFFCGILQFLINLLLHPYLCRAKKGRVVEMSVYFVIRIHIIHLSDCSKTLKVSWKRIHLTYFLLLAWLKYFEKNFLLIKNEGRIAKIIEGEGNHQKSYSVKLNVTDR